MAGRSGWHAARARRMAQGVFTTAIVALHPCPALAWGDEGHKIIALVAEQYLDSAVRETVGAMLAADIDSLAGHDIASEATWADKYRDSDRNGTKERYLRTRQWHFVDIELSDPNLDRACFGHPGLLASTVAANGPPAACSVDKIDQFAAELSAPSTNPEERLLALKFLLHLVGDLHQPLHAADDHDAGGNRKLVAAEGFKSGNLHHFWDTEFVERLGRDPKEVATGLVGQITESQRQEWSKGTTTDWALESYALARDQAYGMLPRPDSGGVYVLSAAYVEAATRGSALQLSRAGVRLALMLNRALAAR
jgi:nuclease S1